MTALRALLLTLPVALAALGACSKRSDPVPPTPKTSEAAPAGSPLAVATASDAHDDGIAWRRGDVDAAFAEARAAKKPVFLYWGAAWCPPCNQMKATLFKQREFVERTQFFVPVYVDGDTPAAQKLGTRFSVSGYPTMVLFTPDGTEITRLPGEADPERYLQVLALGMNSARPVGATLKTALGDGQGLTQDDWRMLAWYSWDTDDQQLVPTAQVPATLQALATRCPAGFDDAKARLMLKTAAAAGDGAAGAKGKGTLDRQAALHRVEAVLSTSAAARDNFDLLTGAMPELVRATTASGSPERRRLLDEADGALRKLAADTSLSNTDRLGATIARVQLATIDVKRAGPNEKATPVTIAEPLKTAVTDEVARADRESKDPYERQTVINAAAYLLTEAGMIDASDALLTAELARSHSPYYFMLDLASNAKKRGDNAAALDWYAKAYDGSKGPATRLQWGVAYVNALVDLTPTDAARIEQTASRILGEVEPVPESFDGRNLKGLSRMATKIEQWNAGGAHAGEAARIADASRELCGKLPSTAPERARCGVLLKVDAKAPAAKAA